MMPRACADNRLAPGEVLRPGGLELTDEALGRCALSAAARVLDVGCGRGACVAHLRNRYGYRAFGIDSSAVARPCAQALADSLPVKDAILDGLLCECVLSLLPDTERTLREFHRVLVPGGCAILSDIYDRMLPQQIREQLSRCGFTVLFWQDHTRALREFAAALALRGQSCADFLPPGFRFRKPGYYLTIARKD